MYETSSIIIDAVLLICFFSIDLIRISTSQSGNKTGTIPALGIIETSIFIYTDFFLALRGPLGVSVAHFPL